MNEKSNKMKAILEFNLADKDDEMEHNRCLKALDMALVLWELVYNERKAFTNYEDDERYKATNLIFDHINTLLTERNINLDELIY